MSILHFLKPTELTSFAGYIIVSNALVERIKSRSCQRILLFWLETLVEDNAGKPSCDPDTWYTS